MDSSQNYHATLSARFVATSLIGCCVLSFSMGRIARNFLLPEMKFEAKDTAKDSSMPIPLAKEGKVIPHTLYTTRNFDTRKSATISSQWLQQETTTSGDVPSPLNVRLSDLNETSEDIFNLDEDEAEHLPAGQHLLVDMDNIDASFLNSEKELATAMINLVDNSGLTLLSYHCHGLSPEGVSCVGVLLESHVSFHTWPTEGVITLDLFTCGSTSLLDSVQLIENLFAIPKRSVGSEPPHVLWAYKRRGFKEQSSLNGSRDTFAYPLGLHGLENKREVSHHVDLARTFLTVLTYGFCDVYLGRCFRN